MGDRASGRGGGRRGRRGGPDATDGGSSPESGRDRLQARLDEFVADNRFTIAVVFPVVGAVTLVASAEGVLPDPLAYNPLLLLVGTAVMRSPLLVGLLPRIDRRALSCLAVLTTYTYAIELVGVRTGWPYGAFEYGVQLGPTVHDGVPLALPLFFVPLALNAYLLAILVLGHRAASTPIRILAAVGTVVAVDLVLDPAAVAIGFWAFTPPGGYYGVPLSNYLGWLLSGVVAVALIDLAFERAPLVERVRSRSFALDDLVSFVVLWGTINALYGNWLPVGVAVCFAVALLKTPAYDLATLRRVLDRGADRRATER